MMKNIQRATQLVVSALGLLGCLGTLAHSEPAKKKDLVIWGVALGPDSKGLEAMIAQFREKHPEYNVRTLSMGAGRMDPQKLMTSIVGEVAPDVIYQDRFTIGDWASRGAFRPLDDFLARDIGKDKYCPEPKQYYPATWEEAIYQGKLYGIPTVADDRILYWNRGLFKKKSAELTAAGLDPNRPPRIWSEMLKYSKVLTEFDSNGTLKRAGFLPNFGNPWLYIYAFQNNGYFMSPDGKKCTLDTPPTEEALKFMVDGYKIVGGYEKAKGFENGFLGRDQDAFITGKVAMKIDGDWILADLARYGPNLDMDTAPAPVPDDRYNKTGRFANEKDQFVTWIGGFSWAIPAGARNPEGGWDFIKYATSVEGRLVDAKTQADWEKRRGRIFIPRLSASIETNKRYYEEFRPADKKFADAFKTHIDMMEHSRIRPVTFVGQRLWNEHTRAIENACIGRMSPKDALIEGQNTVQGELDAVFNQEQYPLVNPNTPSMLFGGAVALILSFLFMNYRKQKMGRIGRTEAKAGYMMILPWFIGFLGLTLGPMISSFYYSFTQYSVLQPGRWIGTKNYTDMFTTDKVYVMKAASNAAYLAGIGTPLGLMTGLAIAMLLNSAVGGIRVYRTIFYMPAIVPVIASAILWSWLLNGDPNRGLINGYWLQTITHWTGLQPPPWLQSESWAKPGLIIMGVWGAGGGMILWLAGLKGISSSLYEAASLDGASPWKQFFSITLPQLSPIVFFNMVMGIIGAVQEFDRIYVMKPSSDGPVGVGDSMLTPVYHLFQNSFAYFKMGYASALAWALFLVVFLLTMIQMYMRKFWVYNEVDK